MAERYGIKKIIVFAYYYKDNKIIKYSFKLIVNVLPKMFAKKSINWIQYWFKVLQANCSIVHILTSFILY